jgi:hypothetical protein
MLRLSIHTDTEWPKDPEAKMNQDGLIEPSCTYTTDQLIHLTYTYVKM